MLKLDAGCSENDIDGLSRERDHSRQDDEETSVVCHAGGLSRGLVAGDVGSLVG